MLVSALSAIWVAGSLRRARKLRDYEEIPEEVRQQHGQVVTAVQRDSMCTRMPKFRSASVCLF